MDEKDILITKELATTPRIPYRELAERLSLSVNSVHKRVQKLVSMGVIVGFRTYLSPLVTGGGFLGLSGRSLSADLNSTVEQIGDHPCTLTVYQAGGQFLYLESVVRSYEEMQEYQSFVRETGKMNDLKAPWMLMHGQPPAKDPLLKLDYRIILSLSDNSRRSMQDVADAVGSTPKTVKRRLRSMEAKRLLYYRLEWNPSASGDVVSIVHAKVAMDRSMANVSMGLSDQKDPHIIGISLSNTEPGLMIFTMWGRDMNELRKAEASINSNNDFESMFSNLFYDMRLYTTWADKLVLERSMQLARSSLGD